MSNPIITVENLSKLYRIGAKEQGYKTFREAIIDCFTAPIRNFNRLRNQTTFDDFTQRKAQDTKSNALHSAPCSLPSPSEDIIYALREVSFEVQPGEIVGIIGRNGAGKSTLLKILSRVTEPSAGDVKIYGKVASLLEVGTGFHPELTGRENIFLNGSILGMRKEEIKKKFDEIVAFAEIERFIDTPVKRYSSGMYVRLAFAVAAHLEPEIMIVDEVLAVGDAAFQKKCLGKMGDIAKGGRTVLFVSHNMAAIQNLCSRSILLENGEIRMDGVTDKVVTHYLNQSTTGKAIASANEIQARMEGHILRKMPHVRFKEIAVLNKEGLPQRLFNSDEQISIAITFQCFASVKDLRILVRVVDKSDNSLILSQNVDDPKMLIEYYSLKPGIYRATCNLSPNIFGTKTFFISVHLNLRKIEHLVVHKILDFEVKFKGYNNMHGSYEDYFFRPQFEWKFQSLNEEKVASDV